MQVRPEADQYEAKLGDILSVARDTLRRRWLTLLAITAAVFGVGVVLIALMTPHYIATAKVRLDPSRGALSGTAATQARAELSDEAIQTEVSAARSLEVAQQIVKSQGLVDDPEFANALAHANSPITNSEARETVVAGALLTHLTVTRDPNSYLLSLTFESVDPIKAARLANAFAVAYIETRASKRVDNARAQNTWMTEQLEDLSRDATNAETRAAEYRARAGIIQSGAGGGAGTIVDQQVAPLTGSLAQAESDAAAARANLAAAQNQVARGGLETVSEVLSSGVIGTLRGQRADVLRNKAEVEARYGERHPESIRVGQQLAGIDSQINAEARRIVASLRATAAAAQARVSSLRGSLGRLENDRERSVRSATVADGLEREAAAKRALYDKMSQASLDTVQAVTARTSVAEVAGLAVPPSRPISPNKPLLYTLALLVGLASGAATIALLEMMSGGFRSIEDMEAQLGIPVLAVVPKVGKKEKPTELMLDRPTSMFAESFRIARTAILGARGDSDIKVIAITSALPAEGKTTTAVAFARTLAIANARVLLVECDIRRAAVRQLVRGAPPKTGLVELLHGEISLDEAIKPGDVPNLDQILVVSPYFSAEDLFGEGRMEQLLEAARVRYDYIVLDLPPLMGLADGRFLAVLADVTALVVKWKSTPIAAATSALGWLRNDGSKPVGVIYTQVDPSAHSVGGLYYYSKQYSDYYQNN